MGKKNTSKKEEGKVPEEKLNKKGTESPKINKKNKIIEDENTDIKDTAKNMVHEIKTETVKTNGKIVEEEKEPATIKVKKSTVQLDQIIQDEYNDKAQKISLFCIWILSLATRLYKIERPDLIWYSMDCLLLCIFFFKLEKIEK